MPTLREMEMPREIEKESTPPSPLSTGTHLERRGVYQLGKEKEKE